MIYKQKLVLWQAEKGDRFQVVNADLTASQRSTHCITEILVNLALPQVYALHHTASQKSTHCITEIHVNLALPQVYALHQRELYTKHHHRGAGQTHSMVTCLRSTYSKEGAHITSH